jgi:hypothetical protein
MANLNQYAITLLSSHSAVDMQTSASTILYTVPAGKTLYITNVVIKDPSLSLVGGTDYSFTNWLQNVDLSSLTTPNTDYIVLNNNNIKYTNLSEGISFQIEVNTGSSASATATIDVFGYLA